MALPSERNDAATNKRITSSARKAFPGSMLDTYFEHGHWWVVLSNGAIYDVVDAEGPGTIDGFDFEQISNGEGDE